jgi:hypothetical protein
LRFALVKEDNEIQNLKYSSLCSSGDTDYIYKNATGIMDPTAENNMKLKDLVGEITQISNYDKSPDCLNVVIRYYLNEGNSEMARNYFNILTLLYEKNSQIKLTIINGDANHRTYEQLSAEVAFLESNVAKSRENASNNPWNNDPSLKEE